MPKLPLAPLALVASALAATMALGAGCTVVTNDGADDDAGVFEAGETAEAGASCASCLATRCIAAQALCLTNASCTDILACRDRASDGGETSCACNAAASDGGPSPERVHHAYTSCNDVKRSACASACAMLHQPPSTLPGCVDDAGADAGDGDAGATGPETCIACAAANCSGTVSACGGGTECGSFLACSSACAGASCVEDCGNRHPTGKVAASELAACTASNCQNDCEL